MPDAGTLFPFVRGLALLAILLLIGTSVAIRVVAQGSAADPAFGAHVHSWHARLPGLLAWFLLTLSLARGTLQVMSFMEPGESLDPTLLGAILLEGTWGISWLIQSCAALALLAGSWTLRHHARSSHVLTLVATAAIAWAQTGLGHANDAVWAGAWGRIVHLSHLIGGGLWLGGLAILALSVFPALRHADHQPLLAGIVRRFSAPARLGAGLLVATGTVAAWQYVGTLPMLFTSSYGLLVVGKIVLFIVIAGAGWWNWRVVTPALGSAPTGASRQLRRAVALELALAFVVLGLTAVLVGTSLPHSP